MRYLAQITQFQTKADTHDTRNRLALSVHEQLTALTTAYGGVLTSFGLTFLSFVAFMQLVKMVVTFSTSNMSFSFNPAPFEGGEIVRFMMRLGFCCLLLTYWTNPLPGASWGFNKLFAAVARQIVTILDQDSVPRLTSLIADAWSKTARPRSPPPSNYSCMF